jgi:hypothetical protein
MVKYITLTDDSGQEQAIPLQNLAHLDTTSTTVLTLEYITPEVANTIVITHGADTSTHEWKLWMTDQIERALASNWREVEYKPENTPTAVSTIVYAP